MVARLLRFHQNLTVLFALPDMAMLREKAAATGINIMATENANSLITAKSAKYHHCHRNGFSLKNFIQSQCLNFTSCHFPTAATPLAWLHFPGSIYRC
mmetsp:Transcript_79500/g.137892  ORF Transcript_79500/g.137892 Transcript_79500/m.137892 type:complete len:98 (+) Transcript_79500:97-390(+)